MKISVNDEKAQIFGRTLLTLLENAPFGSLSKSQLDLALLESLRVAKLVSINSPRMELALQLEVPPSRAGSLVLAHRMVYEDRISMTSEIIGNVPIDLNKLELDSDGSLKGVVTLVIEDRFLREWIDLQAKQAQVVLDTSFNREHVVLSVTDFTERFPQLFGGNNLPTDQHTQLKAKLKDLKQRERKHESRETARLYLRDIFSVLLTVATTPR